MSNAIRSPVAEGLLKQMAGDRVEIESAGIRAGELDAFAQTVMDEIGISLSGHRSKSLESLGARAFDLVVSLTPSSHDGAREFAAHTASEIEYWDIPDPSLAEGSRDNRLAMYRSMRDGLAERLRARFPDLPGLDA